MNNKLKRIETPEYTLWVSDDKIKLKDWYVHNQSPKGLRVWQNNTDFIPMDAKKIIAYQPKNNASELLPIVQYGNMTFKELNGDGSYYECIDCEVQTLRSGEFLKSQGVELYKNNAPELDLPLLPNFNICPHCKNGSLELVKGVEPYNTDHYQCNHCDSTYNDLSVEDDVEKLINKQISNFEHDLKESISTYVKQRCEGAIFGLARLKESYKAATKLFTEDDLIQLAGELSFKWGSGEIKDLGSSIGWSERYIQSLKQSKVPKWFVAETEDVFHSPSPIGMSVDTILKTTTINGKIYLKGYYDSKIY
jgi:hypothetical protein